MGNLRYIFTVLGICIAGYGTLSLWGRSAEYCSLTRSSADLSPCYKFLIADQNVQILLVGDSSLLYGIKPDVVDKIAHHSTYNYGIVGPVFAFNPKLVIDRFLAGNKRPQAIIVYISPWDIIEPGKIHDPIWFPIGLQLLQHGNIAGLVHLLWARPSALVELPQIIAQSTGFSPKRNARLREQMERERGHLDFSALIERNNRSLTECSVMSEIGPVPETAPSRKALAELKAHYAKQGLSIYVYAAPFAQCGTRSAALQEAYNGLSDNIPTPLSDRFFVKEPLAGHAVHVNEEGVEMVSRLLCEFLLTHHIGELQ